MAEKSAARSRTRDQPRHSTGCLLRAIDDSRPSHNERAGPPFNKLGAGDAISTACRKTAPRHRVFGVYPGAGNALSRPLPRAPRAALRSLYTKYCCSSSSIAWAALTSSRRPTAKKRASRRGKRVLRTNLGSGNNSDRQLLKAYPLLSATVSDCLGWRPLGETPFLEVSY